MVQLDVYADVMTFDWRFLTVHSLWILGAAVRLAEYSAHRGGAPRHSRMRTAGSLMILAGVALAQWLSR